jgi:ADP-heptose:LPS heptosyltransferase
MTKVLVMWPIGLGDAIMLTPLLQAVLQLPQVDLNITFPHLPASEVLEFYSWFPWITIYPSSQEVVKQKFDVVVEFGFDKSKFLRKFPQSRVVDWKWLTKIYPSLRYLDWVMGVARLLGFESPSPSLTIPRVEKLTTVGASPRVALGIGYFKGGKRFRKKYFGSSSFGALIRLLDSRKITPILVGGHDDIPNAIEIQKEAGHLVYQCLGWPLEGVFGAISNCNAYIGNDTAMMHAAVALKIPVLVIYQEKYTRIPWRWTCPLPEQGSFIYRARGENVLSKVELWLRKQGL